MDRLFLDANILFSAAYKSDSPLGRFWSLKGVTLISSSYALAEARRNLAAVKPERLDSLQSLIERVQIADTDPSVGNSHEVDRLPDKDRPILLAAIQMKATHLVTSDKKHFGSLVGTSVGGVRVLSPAMYFAALGIEEPE